MSNPGHSICHDLNHEPSFPCSQFLGVRRLVAAFLIVRESKLEFASHESAAGISPTSGNSSQNPPAGSLIWQRFCYRGLPKRRQVAALQKTDPASKAADVRLTAKPR